MKKMLSIFLCFMLLFTTSCSKIKNQNPNILNKLKKDVKYQRIIITSTRLAGKYTIFDDGAKKRFLNKMYLAKDATVDTGLEPDFIIDFYDSNKKVASYKYIVGISDETQANLIDEDGNKFYINNDIEDEFIKRIFKRQSNADVSEYYISLFNDILERIDEKSDKNAKVYIDINKDFVVTRYLTAVDIKKIFDAVKRDGITIVDKETDADFYVKVKTKDFSSSGDKVKTEVIVQGQQALIQRISYEGKKMDGKFTYHIMYK